MGKSSTTPKMNFSDEPCAKLASKSTIVSFIKLNLIEVNIDFNTNFRNLVQRLFNSLTIKNFNPCGGII